MHSKSRRLFTIVPCIALAVGLLSSTAGVTVAGNRAMGMHGAQPVNITVSYNSQIPLADIDEETIAAAQKDSRLMLYSLALGECDLLKSAIAKTCRLTNLNVSSQIQNYGQPGQPLLYVNSNATFAITLKESAGGSGQEESR